MDPVRPKGARFARLMDAIFISRSVAIMTIRLRTLGNFSMELDGTPQPGRPGQPLRSALLLLLALDREVTRESVMALLWPESDDERARQALRQTLYLLRRDLGDAWLDSRRDALRATTQLTADAHELVLAAGAEDHERVLSLYRGTFLAGVRLVESQPFQLWCDQWSGRLERLHRKSRRAAIEMRVAAGDVAAALDMAREWLELQPLEDEAQHRVLELLAHLGRGEEALREYDAFRSLLAREGLEPLDETTTLAEEIRARGRTLPPLGRIEAGRRGSGDGQPVGVPEATGNRGWLRPRILAPLTLAAVLSGVALLARTGGEDPSLSLDPTRVMVLPLINETGDPALDDIGLLAAEWITHLVAHMGGLQAVPFVDVRQMLGAGLDPSAAALHRRAGTLVAGRYFRSGDSLQLHVRITDAASGELWHALDPLRIRPDAPEPGLRELRDRIGGSLGVRFTPASALPRPAVLNPPGYEAFKAFMDASSYISRSDWAGALPHVRRAAELDTTFYRARLGLVSAYMNLKQYARADSILGVLESHRRHFSPYERVLFSGLRASLDGDRLAMLAVASDAARLDPGGTTHYISAGIALAAGRPREAIQLYATLDPDCPWAPEWTGPWADWTAAFHLLGQHERELAEARRARALHPDDLSVLFLELRALTGLGRLGAVEAGLAEGRRMAPRPGWDLGAVLRRVAAEERAHGHGGAADRTLATALEWYAIPPEGDRRHAHQLGRLHGLLAAGRLGDAAAALSELRRGSPDDVTLLGLEGVVAARTGNRARARDLSDQLDARREPYQFGVIDYWRAAIAAWSGDDARAMALLRRAFDEGRPRGIQLHADPWLEPLWHLPAFQTAVAERR
jgi:DNA-binding SARP family transcriptional activator